MELIYAWINDKRDNFFENQGFNFSPNWTVSFDSQTGYLDIQKSTYQFENDFFEKDGKVANITAIIGKNGVGKTRLLHRLGEVIAMPKDSLYDSITVFFENNKFKVFDNTGSNITTSEDFDITVNNLKHRTDKSADSIKLIYYSPAFDGRIGGQINSGMQDSISSRGEEINYKELWNISICNRIYGFQRALKNYHDLLLSGWTHERAAERNSKFTNAPYILDFFYNFRTFQEIESCFFSNHLPEAIDFLPHYISISAHFPYNTFKGSIWSKLSRDIDGDDGKHFRISLIFWLQANITNHNKRVSFKELFVHDTFEGYQNYFIQRLKEIGNSENLNFYKKINYYIKEGIIFFRTPGEGIIDCKSNREEIKTLITAYKAILKPIKGETPELLDYFLRMYWGNVFQQPFSTGEQMLMSLYSSLHYASKKERKKTLILLLDECETGAHPEWQRNYLQTLINFVPKIFCEHPDQNVQIIITSHSPFVISDLPDKNVILLEKKDNKCFVCSDRESFSKTFGANIHTLLSDTFFMKERIGVFAEKKISNVLKKLDENPDAINEEDKHLMSIIGEPLVGRFLMNKLESINQEDKIKQLEKRIAELESAKSKSAK